MLDAPVDLCPTHERIQVSAKDALMQAVQPPRAVPRVIDISEDELLSLIPQVSFGAVALDIALGLLTHAQIAHTWGLTQDQLSALMTHEAFKEELERALAERERLRQDSRGGMTLRARLLAEAGLSDIYRLFKDPDTSPPTKLNIFREFTELGQLHQPKADTATAPQVNITIGAGVRGITIDSNAEDLACT